MKEKGKKEIPAQKDGAAESQRTTLQRLLPHAIAIAIFAFITTLYFAPMLLENKAFRQGDILQGKGMSKEITDFRQQTGKEALWTNSMFGGMPAFQISVMYKGNLLRYIDKILSLDFAHPAELLFLAFICFYILLIVMGVNSWLAVAGAIAYTLCSYNLVILEAGHNTKMHAIAYMPLMLAGLMLLRQRKLLWGGIVTAIGFSLQIYADHFQITYYTGLLIIAYGIFEVVDAIRRHDWKPVLWLTGIGLLAGIFAFLTNLSVLWSTYDYLPSTIRGPSELASNKQSSGGLDHDYAFQWSYGKMETFTLLIPDFYGGSSDSRLSENSNFGKLLEQYNVASNQREQYLDHAPTYFGDQPFTGGPVYLGAITCFLFVLGMFIVKGRTRWWLFSISVLAILLAWGRNLQWFSDLFFYHFPGYNKFRTVYMIMVLLQFAFPLLGMLALNKILKRDYNRQELLTKLKYSVYITGGLCLLFAVAGGIFLNFRGAADAQMAQQQAVLDAIIADRKAMLRTDAFRSLVFILLAAGLIWAYVNDRVKQAVFLAGTIALIFCDLFFVGKRYLDSSDFVSKSDYAQVYAAQPADELIMKDPSLDYRVLNLATNTFNDAQTSYFHKSVGGYHAAKLRRYQDIIEHQLTADSSRHSGYPFNKSVVDMLNTKYLIVPDKNHGEQVMPNPQALGNAWFVQQVKMVDNADAEMAALSSFDPRTTALVDKRFASQLTGYVPTIDSTASVKLEKYEPNDLIYKTQSKSIGVVVFSEIYYQPGWDAFIDGKKTDHFRCDYILRGMRVPAGTHTIEFRFEPESYLTGEKVAYASSGLLLLVLAGAVGLSLTKRKD